jgi:ABC-type multidrug transport system ATPase subunit
MTTSEERRLSNVIGYVEQQEPFLDTMTVEEHLLFQVNAIPLANFDEKSSTNSPFDE